MNRDEWLAWRRQGIGASDVAAILGLSPWQSAWSVWASKANLAEDDHESESMEFGRRAEPMVGPWFHELTGLHIAGEQTRCSHPADPWKRCTVDGFVVESTPDTENEVGAEMLVSVAEIKTTSDPAKKWADDGIPVHYQTQAAWISHVTGIPTVHFVVVHLAYGRPQLRVYEYTPPADDVALVVERVTRFWTEHVLTGDPPPVDDHPATTTALNHAWPDAEPDPPVEADDELLAVVRELDAVRSHIRADKKRAEALENIVKARLQDRTELVYDGALVCSWRPQERRGLDAERVRAAHGDAYDTRSTFRKMLTHLPKRERQPTP